MTGDHDVLSVTYGERAGCAVVRVAGTLDVAGYPRLRDVMLKCAAEQPSAVIVVVERLQVATASLLSVFAQVSMRLSDWPAVPVLLVAADESARRLFEHAPVSRFVPVFRTVESAVRGVQRGMIPSRSASSMRSLCLFVQRGCPRRGRTSTAGHNTTRSQRDTVTAATTVAKTPTRSKALCVHSPPEDCPCTGSVSRSSVSRAMPTLSHPVIRQRGICAVATCPAARIQLPAVCSRLARPRYPRTRSARRTPLIHPHRIVVSRRTARILHDSNSDEVPWPNATAMLAALRAVGFAAVEPIEVLTAGFPCQDISAAGRRAGIDVTLTRAG
ncbi:STAS domain-containing protein [Amycolatopsis magusensis]|uniref:STAS domain-containing protein n=1 Tax=Amycolatopsis magusensis TaxID=882444 RepID=UPI00379C0A4E